MSTWYNSQLLFILFLISLHDQSSSSITTPLLSLACTSSSNQTYLQNKTIEAILNNLTSEVTKTFFTTLNINVGNDQFSALMQCRLGMASTTCNTCARKAEHKILNLCPNSDAITAWFNGCYIQYSRHEKIVQTTYSSCSNRTISMDDARDQGDRFESAVGGLLLKLRAEENLATRHGLSYGEIKYSNTSSKVYGLVECVRSLSPSECEVCAGKAIDKLHECCVGKDGGTVVLGSCLVRFESYKFFFDHHGGDDHGGSSYDNMSVWQSRNDDTSCIGCKTRFIWAWSGAAACVFGMVLLAWLLKRSVVNRAKVVMLGDEDEDQMEGKGRD